MIIEKKIKTGIFASSESFSERIKRSEASSDLELNISFLGLSEAVSKAKEMEQEGVEIIIGRRGTAHILRENLSIPVLSFPHRSLEVLTGLNRAKAFGDQILFPVFRQKIDTIYTLEEILKIKVIQTVYDDNRTLEDAVIKGKQMGCSVVVGGNLTGAIAKDIGMNFIGIDTSDDDIASTIDSAKSVALSNREEKAKTKRYRSIIESSNDGMIAVDANEKITIINSAARKILDIEENVEGKPLNDYIPEIPLYQVIRTSIPVENRLDNIKGRKFVSNHLPITLDGEIIGAVSVIQDFSNVMKSEKVVRKSLSKGFVAKYSIHDLIHRSEAMKDVVSMLKQFSRTDSSILVVGETGTGKEIVANSIHNLSRRKNHPFVSVNCAALPEQLLESELFGYEEGAFTGSRKGGKPGLFELAHQGTIFLDEIDSTPLKLQVSLLRVIQEKEVRRLGGEESIPVDVRIITAGRDLVERMKEGLFREDLFFRLNVLRITVPPLRKREEDIQFLLKHFLKHFSKINKMKQVKIPDLYMKKLNEYSWPGNVRQLRNFSEKLVLNSNLISNRDSLDYLFRELSEYSRISEKTDSVDIKEDKSLRDKIRNKTMESEALIIEQSLRGNRYNRSKTAKELNISRSTLWRKIKEYGLD